MHTQIHTLAYLHVHLVHTHIEIQLLLNNIPIHTRWILTVIAFQFMYQLLTAASHHSHIAVTSHVL